jgi:hypothetical protein
MRGVAMTRDTIIPSRWRRAAISLIWHAYQIVGYPRNIPFPVWKTLGNHAREPNRRPDVTGNEAPKDRFLLVGAVTGSPAIGLVEAIMTVAEVLEETNGSAR